MLRGKNAIITGARSGIGLATMRLFAQLGANIWAVIHRDDSAWNDEVRVLQNTYNIWIKPIYIDLSNSDSIREGCKTILQERTPINILVNAAGIVGTSRLFTMTRMSDVRQVMDVNFFAILEIIQSVSRVMLRQKEGSIINISSIAADCEDTSQLEYAASKAALICATRKLAREFGRSGVRVNAISPGLTATKMINGISDESIGRIMSGHALGRVGTPEEIATVIAFLASDSSSYINGENIKIDGGGVDLRLMINQ